MEAGVNSGQASPGQGQLKPEQLEIDRLRRELEARGGARHTRSCGLLRDEVNMEFRFVAKHRGVRPARWLCEALDVSRSGFHVGLTRSPSARARRGEILEARIKTSFIASDRTYRARRVWHDLLADGASCGLHQV